MTGTVAWHPISPPARDGRSHLVKDEDGHLYCARFHEDKWRCAEVPIERQVVLWATRGN